MIILIALQNPGTRYQLLNIYLSLQLRDSYLEKGRMLKNFKPSVDMIESVVAKI